MKTLIASAAALFTTAAFAHEGAHAHPHGAEGLTALLFLVALIGVVIIARKVKK